VKVADLAAAGTVTETGTVNVALEFARVTLAPPVGAAWVSVTVQVLDELAPMLEGLQASDDTSTGATRLTTALAELLLYVAVTVALVLLLTVAVVTVKVADVAAAPTLTEAGTVNVALEFVRVTLAPPVGAAWVRVTVQVLEELGPRLLGLQDNADTKTDAARLTVVFAEVLL
jgi:hypothetical protein